MTNNPISIRIVAGDYTAFKQLMPLETKLPATYGRWLERALEHAKKSAGSLAESVTVHPQEFTDWCDSCSLDVNFTALEAFAVYKCTKQRQLR